MWKWVCLSALALGAAAAAGRPQLTGTWQLDRARSQPGDEKLKSETLSIQQGDDSVQISDDVTETDGKEHKSDIQCNTVGKECKLKSEQVSAWYNGPILVIIETRRGNEVVVRKRLKTSDDGQTLSMEVDHLAPPSEKNETYTFTKSTTTAARP